MSGRRITWLVALAVVVLMAAGPPVSASPPTSARPLTPAPTVTALPPITSGGQDTQMANVSCPSTTWCAAVGSLSAGGALPNGSGSARAAAWIKSGGTWRASVLPLPANARAVPQATLGPISCSSPEHCVAVGSYWINATDNNVAVIVETLDGSSWHATGMPLIHDVFPGGFPPYLSGLSCPSLRSCVAVGTAQVFAKRGGIKWVPVVYQLRGGRWTGKLLGAPKGTGFLQLENVSCATVGRCDAVGYYETGDGPDRALVETLSHGRWKATADLSPRGVDLRSVSCPSSATCTAVGFYSSSINGPIQAVAVTLHAGRWVAHLFGDVHASSSLASVSCTTSACVAVGSYPAHPSRGTLIEARRDGHWSAGTAPTGITGLVSVSCPAAGSCVAVNDSEFAAGVATLSGRTWSFLHLASPPAQPEADLSAVSCPSPGNCVAVGSYQAGGRIHDLIETSRDANGWTATAGADPRQGPIDGLEAVSCAPHSRVSSGCTGVGGTVVATDTTGRWAASRLAAPAGTTEASLDAVSCSRPTDCTATGSVTLRKSGVAVPLIAVRSGDDWTTAALPAPQGSAITTSLTGVSCVSPTSCMAVGGWFYDAGGSVGLAERLSHGRWRATTFGTEVDGVSCTTATSCVAVGTTNSASAVARFDGRSWKVVTVARSKETELTAVACPKKRACQAALSSSFQGRTLGIVTVTPSSARITSTIHAPAPGLADLFGISCPTTTTCAVVGGDEAPGGSFALAGVS